MYTEKRICQACGQGLTVMVHGQALILFCPYCGKKLRNKAKRITKPKGAGDNYTELGCWPEGLGVSVSENSDGFIVSVFYKQKRLTTAYGYFPVPVSPVCVENLIPDIERVFHRYGIETE